jgi:hypothetical protein
VTALAGRVALAHPERPVDVPLVDGSAPVVPRVGDRSRFLSHTEQRCRLIHMNAISEADIQHRLRGAWRLVSWEQVRDDETVAYPLGADAAGQLMYTAPDRVSAQLVRTQQAPFASDDWQRATAEEMRAAWPSYFGYFGTFSIDLEQGAVIHHIDGSWFPNLVGSQQVRRFSFEDGRLVLDADTTWGAVRIVWDKI